MPGGSGVAEVRLVDLEVIKRYSLAVRRDRVPALELLQALEASQAVVRAALADGEPPAGGSPASTVRRRRASAPPSSGAVPRPSAGTAKAIKAGSPKARKAAKAAGAALPTSADPGNKTGRPARKSASRRGGP
ncbi:MAG TPA: hypothetical protein VGI06_03140 [Acidimicrobiales bacterium]